MAVSKPRTSRKDTEADRIREVYRGYIPAVSGRWNPDNAGNRLITRERLGLMCRALTGPGVPPLAQARVLEVGCGGGAVLEATARLGARPDRCVGVDLLPERVRDARARCPAMAFHCGDAERLGFADGVFDVVVAFTLFSSVLDEGTRQRIARETARVLAPSGVLLWYDIRYDNPSNPHVRGMTRVEIGRLFPGFGLYLRTATVLPPLVRRLGRLAPFAYPVLARLPPLRTHYLGLLRREPPRPAPPSEAR